MTRVLVLFVTFVACACAVQAQNIRVCGCSEIEPCKKAYIDNLHPCNDHCKHHGESVGAKHSHIKQCIDALEPKIKVAISCFETKHANSCGAPKMVQKRYPETLKLAIIGEAEKALERSGLTNEAQEFVHLGKEIFGCMHKCLEKKADKCHEKLNCGLDLPSDNVLVEDIKHCALQAGINNAVIQETCQCAVNAGVTKLAGMCSRITVF